MSNQETARKMGKLYTETLRENTILLKKMKEIKEINIELRQQIIKLTNENALLSESVRNYKEMLRKLKK